MGEQGNEYRHDNPKPVPLKDRWYEDEIARLRASSVTLQGALDEALGEVGRLREEIGHFTKGWRASVWQPIVARLTEHGYIEGGATYVAMLESADKMLEEVAGAGKVDVPGVDWIDYQIDRDLAARIDAYLAGRTQ